MEGTWDFSFSGLKTAVLRVVRQLEEERRPLPVADLAASFQAAVVDVLLTKTLRAAQKFGARYATFGFNDSANLDDGAMWPTSFALKELTADVEAKLRALVKQAVS